ncbi:hypothetical protein PILCRDRAFT_5025 [Piloderma croceum F 1598]|uniref:Uncharacterized protein n=1 Tax=Piloderma croceum (strain F 1598) TaxID=765440 RepID=A0A0C3BHX6_PILCF|nr:hypothetical protein PILCRDRAFT_5025 [Piloderma croceum F 1598]
MSGLASLFVLRMSLSKLRRVKRVLSFPDGWYAIERTSTFINVWFWDRHSDCVPSDVVHRRTTIDTDNLGTPSANSLILAATLPPSLTQITSSSISPFAVIMPVMLIFMWPQLASIMKATILPLSPVLTLNLSPSTYMNKTKQGRIIEQRLQLLKDNGTMDFE